MLAPHRRTARTSLLVFIVMAMLATTTLLAGDATADDNPATDGFSMTCDVQPSFTPDTVTEAGVPGVVAGESMTFSNRLVLDPGTIYQDILERPDGSIYYASYLELIDLPSNVLVDSLSAQFTIDGVAQALLNQSTPDPSSFVLETVPSGGNTIYRILFPGDEAQMLADQSGEGLPSWSVGPAAQTFELSFEGTMPLGSLRGTVEPGAECFASLSTGPSNRDTDRPRTAVVVVEPEMTVQKRTALDNAYQAGGLVSFDLVANVPVVDNATQFHAVAAPQDVVLVDNVPLEMAPAATDGTLIPTGGTTTGGGVWDELARTVTYSLGALAPGSDTVITDIFMIDPSTPQATDITNEVCASFTTLGEPAETRLDGGCDTALVTTVSQSPSVTKRALRIPDGADLDQYGLELPFWFEVTVDLPAGVSYENFTILDQLPDGFVFNSYVSDDCQLAGATCVPAPPLTETVFPAGNGTTIGWYPNSVPFDAAARTYTFRYEVELAPTYGDGTPVSFNDVFENQLSVNWNTVDRLGAVPPATASPPPFDLILETSDIVEYDRPILVLDKVVDTSDGVSADTTREPWDYELGKIATFTLEVENQGSTDAYNMDIVDSPTGFAIDVATVLIDGVACGTCTMVGDDLTLTVPGPLAPGATIVITYDAAASANGEIDNAASVPTYEDEFATAYTENPADTTGLLIPEPVLELAKDNGDITSGFANTRGTRYPFVFTVTNPSATTAYTPVVTDTPPAGFCNFDGGLDASAAGTATETSAGVWALDAPVAPGTSVQFTAWLEVCDEIEPGTYVNTADLTWFDLQDNVDENGDAYTDSDVADIVLVGPEFKVEKTPAVSAGATLRWSIDTDNDPPDPDGLDLDELNGGVWTIIVTNEGTAPIGGLNVVDPMPQPFEYLPGSATVTWIPSSAADTFTDNSVSAGSGAVWEADGYGTVADFTIGQLAPGAEIRIQVPFVHNGEDPDGGALTRLNTAEVRNENLDYDADAHSAQGEYTLIPVEAGPLVSKTVAEDSATPGIGTESVEGQPGGQFDFAIEVTLPTKSTTSLHDVWILDTLPDGLFPVNEPVTGAVPNAPATGWTVSCTANCGTGASAGGQYLGSQPGSNGTTELAWWFDEVVPDASELPIVYLVTFRAEVDTTFDNGNEIIDGFDEPLVNIVEPIFNRDASFPGGTGDNIVATPAGVPNPDTFERIYPLDPADIDIVTPRIDLDKMVQREVVPGEGLVEITEVTAGDTFTYTVTATNNGTGDAFDIDINDTLGTPTEWTGPNFMSWDIGTLNTSPAGVTCNVYQPDPANAVEHMLCEYPGPLAPGESVVITLEASTVPNDEFFAQASANNYDPMIIRNEATAPEYWNEAGESGLSFSVGEANTRIFAYTPMAEIDSACVSGLVEAPVGTDVQFWTVLGNGDRFDVAGNPDGDRVLIPNPTEDLDGDGYPDAGVGHEPEVRITLQDKFTFQGITATGPGVGDPTYSAFVPFTAPDQILTPGDQGAGTYTLVWDAGTLDNIPHVPNHTHEGNFRPHEDSTIPTDGSFLPHYAFLIDVTKTEAGGGTIWSELIFQDAAGNFDRGTSVGEPFTLAEKHRQGCPGGPPPQVWKYPDTEDNVRLLPGGIDEFVIVIQQPFDDAVPTTFVDKLPPGLSYRGDLDPADPEYAVATMDTVPATWPAGSTLEDYFVSSTSDQNGTTITWNPPDLPTGLSSDPNAGGADTRHVIRIPVKAVSPAPFPNEFAVNSFEWGADGSPVIDNGAIFIESEGKPSIEKRVDESAKLYGESFQYTIDITLPAGYQGRDVIVYDEINRYSNWETDVSLQAGSTNWASNSWRFPFAGVGSFHTAAAGEVAHLSYPYSPAEMELGDYVSHVCLSGCGDPADQIDIVPLPPDTLDTAGTLPISSANPEVLNRNGAIGWYLGDIDPATTDRVLRLVYDVEAPTLDEQRQRLVDLAPSSWPTGIADPLFDDRDSRYFQELSHIRFPNLVQIRHFTSDDATLGTWEGASDDDWETGSNAWLDRVGSSIMLNQTDELVSVSYPIIDMTKQCGAIGGTSDPLQITRPSVTAVGTPNVECTVSLINRSPVEAFDVNVTDQPINGDACNWAAVVYWGEYSLRSAGRENSGNAWHPSRSASGTGVYEPDDPNASLYNCEIDGLAAQPSSGAVATTAGDFPIAWDLQIGAEDTETLTYQMRIDGWTEAPADTQHLWGGTWQGQGMWFNEARLAPWAGVADGETIGSEVIVSDHVAFDQSFINIRKAPYPEGRNPCTDAAPFIQWNQLPDANYSNQVFWNNFGTAGFDPDGRYGSEIRTQGNDYCDDPLIPPDQFVSAYSYSDSVNWPIMLTWFWRRSNTYVGNFDNYETAVPGSGNGWTADLRNVDVWSPQYYARPTEAYRWSIDLRVDGLQHLSDIDITDTLPVGWEYVPGSATILDGNWLLGIPTTARYDSDLGFQTGYGEIPLPDPSTANPPDGTPACHADSNNHSGGQTMTWNFERDGGGSGDQPWQYQYVDASTRYSRYDDTSTIIGGQPVLGFGQNAQGWSGKNNNIRIHYYATPLAEVFDCDPDPTSSQPFLMENNVSVSAIRENPASGQGFELTDRFDVVVPVINPVNFEKLPDDDYVSDDTTAYFTILFENNLSESVLNLPVTDELRASLPPLPGGGYACGTATATIDGAPTVITETQCDNPLSQATDLTWVISEIAPNETLEITIPVIIPEDETNSLRWDNTASTVVKEFFNSPFTDDARITVLNPSPPPPASKTVSPNPATVNDLVTYEVSFTADALRVFMDLAYIDTVPDGLTFVDHLGVSCSGGCPNGFTADDVITMTPQTNADGSTTLMWWFGDMPGSNQAHTWTMTYTARVDATYRDGSDVVDEDELVNIVNGYSNHENLIDGDPAGLLDPSAWAGSEFAPSTGQATLDIEEPELAITKGAVSDVTPADGSATITFTVNVENVGGIDAHNVVVNDTPNLALENIVLPNVGLHPNAVITAGWTAIAPEVSWFITTLPQGETATFTYTAEVKDTFLVDGQWVALNEANIAEFYARPGVEQDPDDRGYVGDSAVADLPLAAPAVEIEKFVGGCSDEFAFAELGQPTAWCLRISSSGDTTAYNTSVTEVLPYLWTYDASSAAGTGWAPYDPAISTASGVQTLAWDLGDMEPGDVIDIEFTATPGDGSPEVVTNWASVEMQQADGTPYPITITQARDRNPAVASIGRFGLEIAKTPDRQEWGHLPAGGVVAWDLTITNPAEDTTNTNLTVTDYLPAPLTFNASTSADARVSAPVVGTPGAGPGGTTEITWTISDLGPLESVVIELDANSTGGEVPLQWYINDVEVTSDQIPDLVANQAKVRFYEPASVGDFVFADADVDGIQDVGEPGVNGAIVTLLDSNGDPLYRNPTTGVIYTSAEWNALDPVEQAAAPIMQMATQNDPDTGLPGWYEFAELPPGNYQIEFDPTPTGLWPTIDEQGTDDAQDSDANRFTGLSHVFALSPGENDPTIDMGLITPEQFDESLAGVDVEKWTDGVQADIEPGPALVPGDAVVWTYQVTNSGSTSLVNIPVTDSVEGDAICDVDGDGTWDGTNLIPFLLPGESRNCYITGVVGDVAGAGTGQYANTAETAGTPVLPDFDTCGCDPDDPSSWPTDPAENEPAVGSDGVTPLADVTDDDPSHYFSASPSLDIEKDTNGFDADTPQGPVVIEGETVTWTYEVENTGNTALDNVTVTDDQGVTVVCDVNDDDVFDDATGAVIGFMLPGDTVTCQGTGTAAVGPYMNVGAVTGDPVLPDPATCGCDLTDPDSWPDDESVFTSALDPAGDPLEPVTDDDPSHHLAAEAEIDIEKDTNFVQSDLPPGDPILNGDAITWSYVVTNEGTTALLNATVTDSDPGITVDCDPSSQVTNVIPLLLPDESVTCVATGTAELGGYANTSDVVGTPAFPADPSIDPTDPDAWPNDADDYTATGTPDVDDTDDSHYYGHEGGLELEKSTNGIDADLEPGVALDPGDAVVWTYTVTNTSNLVMLDATVLDSDIGAAIDCGAGTNVIAILMPGDTVTCTSTTAATAVAGQYHNDSTVSGLGSLPTDVTAPGVDLDDPDTWPTDAADYTQFVDAPFTDDDPSNYFALAGGLELEKSTNSVDSDSAPGEQILEGAPVTWTYAVTNNSNAVMINVLVEDSDPSITVDCGDGSDRIPVLAIGETVACTATGTAELGLYMNDSDVVGQPAIEDPENPGGPSDDPGSYVPTGHTSTDEDPSHYFGSEPAIDIEKATNGDDADTEVGPILDEGAAVTWTYVVTNTGNVPLGDVTVTDSQGETVVCPVSGDNTIALLLPGASVTCEATGTAELGQYENIADVTGTPVELDDPAADPADPANYSPSGLDEVTDDDPSHYIAHDGEVMIVKTTNDVDANTAPGAHINIGDPVVWKYTVANTSDTPLVDLVVTDDQGEEVDCGDGSNSIDVLLPGETHICTASGVAGAGQYTNVGDVTGLPGQPNGEGGFEPIPGVDPVTDDDPSNYLGHTPGIDIEKDTNGLDADDTVGPVLAPGDPVTWTYEVTNTGDVPLTDVVVTDSQGETVICAVSGDNTIALLLPGQEIECQATGVAALGAYENIADVTGVPSYPTAPTPGCCDPADPGSWPTDAADFAPTGQDDVIDDDPSHYIAHDGDVLIEKSTNSQDADVVPGPIVDEGSTVTWTYAVSNTSDTTLIDLIVTDDQGEVVDCGNGTNRITELAPGATHYCTATGTAVEGQYANIGSVTGTPAMPNPVGGGFLSIPGADPATDDDPSHYLVGDPAIDIEKDTNGDDADNTTGPLLAPGDPVTWTYVVTNTGDVALIDVEVTDSQGETVVCPSGDHTIALFLPGDSVTCTATGTAAVGAYENIADVTGTPAQLADPAADPSNPANYEPTGQDDVIDDDPSHYTAYDAALEIEKATNGEDADVVPGPIVNPGDPVTWTYAVTNPSNTPVMNAVVSDDQGVTVNCGNGTNTIPVVLPGETVTCTGSAAATEGQYENLGSVTGTPALEDPENPGTYDPIDGADPVGDDDPSHYFGSDPSIDIEKATNTEDADVEVGPILEPGDVVTWTYVVTNDGLVPLADATVTDDQGETVVCDIDGNGAFDDATATIPLLLPGDSVSCEATGSASIGLYRNVADVSGTPVQLDDPAADPSDPNNYSPTGQDDVDDDDPSHYVGSNGSVQLEKFTNGIDADVAPGPIFDTDSTVTWTYTVLNTSDTPLIDLAVTDDIVPFVDCGDGSNVIDLLLPGETHLCTADGSAIDGEYANIGEVEGTPAFEDPEGSGNYNPIPGADPVGDDDPSHYTGADPSIAIEKDTNGLDADDTSGPILAPGDDVTWTYVVTNDGDVALADVTVLDSQGEAVDCSTNPGGSGNVLALLLPGESATCTATGSAILGAYENVADVSGTPSQLDDPAADPTDPANYSPTGQDDVVDDDPSHYIAHDGAVLIEKSTNGEDADVVPGPIVDPGGDVIWTYAVTNTSATVLINVIVTDDQGEIVDCGNGSNVIAALQPGVTHYCEATGTAAEGQYMNLGSVVGTPAIPDLVNGGYAPIPGAEPAIDDDPSHYLGSLPSIDIEKATNGDDADVETGPILVPGDDVTWTYVVTNDGDVPLTDATVTDDDPAVNVDCGDGTNVIGLLLPGASVTCEATGTAELGQYENVADVVGTPAQPSSPTAGCCDLDDPASWPTDPADFEPTGQDDVVADDPSHYVAHDASIAIEKSTNGEDADVVPGPIVTPGGDVTWTYAVTNTSDTTLIDVDVTDDQGVTVDCGFGTNRIDVLEPGQTVTCTATGEATEGQYMNLGSVTGTPALEDPDNPGEYSPIPDAEDVTDEDPSHYLGAEPSVDIEKATNGDDADTLFGPIVAPGDAITWTFVVTNDGPVPLADLTVGDDDTTVTVDCGDGTNGIEFLLPGAAATCEATGTAGLGTYRNVGDVTGTPVQPTNPSDGCCDLDDPDSWPTDPADFEPTGQDDVADDDPSHYVANDGDIVIEKSTNGEDADQAPGPIVDTGSEVVWEYTVVNTSATPLIDVTISDDQGEAVDCGFGGSTIPVLMPGETHTCTATGTAEPGGYANVGSVVGTPAEEDPENPGTFDPLPGVDPVTDEDPSHYLGADPSIDIEKATNGDDADVPLGPVLTPGSDVTWTYVVTNDGEVPLADATVGDNDPAVSVDCGDGTNVIGLLLPGASATCTASGIAEIGAYANIGDVTGTPVQPTNPTDGCCDPSDPDTWPTDPSAFEPTGQEDVNDDDPSHYVGADGGVMIEKSTNGQDADIAPGVIVDPGAPITWTYTVANTSDTPLIDLRVADDQGVFVDCGNGTNVISLLLPGSVTRCTATGDAADGDYVNVGSVLGQPATEDPDNPGSYLPIDDTDPVGDEDPSNHRGAMPSVDIEKATNGDDADNTQGPVLAPGDVVTWTYVVTNDGEVPLLDAAVTDDDPDVIVNCGAGNVISILLPGESVTCQATGTAELGQYENNSTVTGTPAQPNDPTADCCDPSDPDSWPTGPDAYDPTGQDDVTDEDPSHYVAVDPSVRIEKATNGTDADTAPGPIVTPGSDVTWTYLVTNDGRTPIIDLVVTDDQGVAVDCGDGTNEIAQLLPGQMDICTGDGSAADGAYENLGSVTGTPAVENPDDPDGELVAVVDDGGVPLEVGDDDPSHHIGLDPSVAVEKATNGEDADFTVGPLLAIGDAVTWTYVVTNDGEVPLTNVSVTDNDPAVAVDCGDGTNVVALLLPGASTTCEATGEAELGEYENIAVVSGTPSQPTDPAEDCCDPTDPDSWPTDPEAYEPTGQDDVAEDDPSHYVAHDGEIIIQKSTNGFDADELPGPVVAPGDPIEWSYVVTNASDTPLVNVTVSDDQGEPVDCGDGGSSIELLLPGETYECTAPGVAQAGQYGNIGTVTGTPGQPDPDAPGGYLPIPGADPVSDNDPSHYFGGTPSIDIEKATNGNDSDEAPGLEILENDPIEWTYVVTNTGDMPVVNVEVTDDQGVEIDCGDGTALLALLAPGESVTCIGNGIAGADDYVNIGDVGGTPAFEDPEAPGTWLPIPERLVDPVGDDDPSHYDGVALELDLALQKQLVSSTTQNPPRHTFSIEVFNQGTVSARDIMIVDHLPERMLLDDPDWIDNGDGTASMAIPGPIAPGDSVKVEITTKLNGFGRFENIAGLSEALAEHPVSGEPLDLLDVDSTLGDTDSDPVVDDVTDNTGGDEDDSDIAVVERSPGVRTPPTVIPPQPLPPGFGGTPSTGGGNTPERPGGPQAFTNDGPSGSGGGLAYTGSNARLLTMLGLTMVLAGAAFVAASKKRRRDDEDDEFGLEWKKLED